MHAIVGLYCSLFIKNCLRVIKGSRYSVLAQSNETQPIE